MKALKQNYAQLWLMSLAFVSVLLVACTNVMPQSFNQRAVIAVATVTEVRNTAAALLTAKKISVEDAENIQRQADTAMQGIAVARQLHAVNAQGADARLNAVHTVLTALQAYLNTKGSS